VRLAHISDPHLGIRQYHRQTPTGVNQREADIANAFRSVIDDVIAVRPDVVIFAGDLFHSVRPTNAAIVFAFRQFQRLRDALPDAPVILVAGNHDTPRSSETGSILKLFVELGMHVAADDARQLAFPDLDLAVLAVPHQALVSAQRPVLRPEGNARYQVLTLHGEYEGIIQRGGETLEYGGAIVSPAEVAQGEWSYVAWGHYHVQYELDTRSWYPGSLEYTSNNIWGELHIEEQLGRPGKAWLLVDLDSGEVERRPVALARRVIDLPPIDAEGMDAKELDGYLARSIAAVPGGITGTILRQVVHDVPRTVAREIDHAQVRAWKADALLFQLDLRRPIVNRTVGVGAPGRRLTLPELVKDWLGNRMLPGDIDRDEFVARGVELVERAETDGGE
jgi:DNA repair exonuclease SbcCD nuclease subunit